MTKRFYPQKTPAEKSIIKANTDKIKRKRASLPNEKVYLPEILSLLVLSNDNIKCYTTVPHMNSLKFKSKESLYSSCAIASLLITNFNLKFINSPHLICEDPKSYVASNNLKFPVGLGHVSGLTRNQKFLKLDYQAFCEKITRLLNDNLSYLNPSDPKSFYNQLPTEGLKTQARKACLRISTELHKIKTDPYYLHIIYESIYVLLTTNKNDCILKGI